MRGVGFLLVATLLCACARGSAPTSQPASRFSAPLLLTLDPDPPTVYAPPPPPTEKEGLNEGGVHVGLDVAYMTDYIFRGLNRSAGQGLSTTTDPNPDFGGGPNIQFDGKLSWDLGKLPHPYIELFVNVDGSDPVSRFQVVQPIFGLEWTIRPVILEMGQESFIYPERDDLNTADVFAKITLDDSYFFRTERPIFSPYVLAAYDYDLYDGWYLQMGVRHDFPIGDTGITLSLLGDVAIALSNPQFATTPGGDDSGWQHYDIGLVGTFSLNQIFNLSRRYGEFSIKGYLFYTDGIENDLLSSTELWGGCGVSFKY